MTAAENLKQGHRESRWPTVLAALMLSLGLTFNGFFPRYEYQILDSGMPNGRHPNMFRIDRWTGRVCSHYILPFLYGVPNNWSDCESRDWGKQGRGDTVLSKPKKESDFDRQLQDPGAGKPYYNN